MKTMISSLAILLFGAGCGKLGGQPIKRAMAYSEVYTVKTAVAHLNFSGVSNKPVLFCFNG